MTTAKQLVTSLEISQRFADLGVPQGQSYFVWIQEETMMATAVIGVVPRQFINKLDLPVEILCDAFTLSELLYFTKRDEFFTHMLIEDNYIAEEVINDIEKKRINPTDLKL